ncbi:MAG TPA: ABC transporter permease subunit, partial [Gemmatimonadales bacterium]|nr:ABC transporter permease subunit [Gemmatimonadales bacterium]
AFFDVGREWSGVHRPAITIDLSASALPRYTMFSLSRGVLAYIISLAFTLVYGYWAAKDRVARRVLLPLLDILQSIPVLGFMPGLVLSLVALFPQSNVGLELAAVLMIFSAQVWNMTFSFEHSLRSVPADLSEAATVYRFSWWQRLRQVELPFASIGLVWNSMLSMAAGWFFLMINESFQLGARDFRLPGIGSYMSVAVEQGRVDAMILGIVAMVAMIVVLDQLLWRPIVVWSQKFRVEESGDATITRSWFLDWLRHSRLVRAIRVLARRIDTTTRRSAEPQSLPSPAISSRPAHPRPPVPARGGVPWSLLPLGLLIIVLAWGGWKLVQLLRHAPAGAWGSATGAGFLTLGRVLISTAIGTVWALPAGLAIGLSSRLSRVLQPVVQIAASFPAPMLFPLIIALLQWAGITLGWGSILLMLLGTQWYILFNVIAGAMALPTDLKEATRSYGIRGWQRFRTLYFPGVFPYLVTGWVTAAGGAWNASIVSEYVTFKGHTVQTSGLGAQISGAAANADFSRLAAAILVMSVLVVAFNRTVWRWCYRLAEERFAVS